MASPTPQFSATEYQEANGNHWSNDDYWLKGILKCELCYVELSKRLRWCIWTPYFCIVKIYQNISEPAEVRILTADSGGAWVISVGHGAEKPGLVPVAGFSGKLEDQPHLEIQPYQSKPKFGLFLFHLTWAPRKAGDQVQLCCHVCPQPLLYLWSFLGPFPWGKTKWPEKLEHDLAPNRQCLQLVKLSHGHCSAGEVQWRKSSFADP